MSAIVGESRRRFATPIRPNPPSRSFRYTPEVMLFRAGWVVPVDRPPLRDAAVAVIQAGHRAGRAVAGFEGDRAARQVIEKAGYGAYFVHRTGHSIDRDLHGSGPHLDDYETHDDRQLLPGVGFSVEPGIYLPGEFGIRSEINVYWGPEGPTVTPGEPQRELIRPGA